MGNERNSAFLYGGMSSEAEIQKEYYEKGQIYTLQIELTLKCSQGCSYCYASSKPDSPHGLPIDDVKAIIDDASEIEVRCIDWLGGDPLVRSGWYDIMRYSQQKGLINNIWTSGLPLKSLKVAKKAVEVTENGGFISVHLDSLNPEIYKQVHRFRIKENIATILQGVDNVLSLGKSPDELWNCITLTKPVASTDVFETMEWFWNNKGIRTVLTLYNPVSNSDSQDLVPSNELVQKAYQ
ncbi:MAG: radical SAM protein, partial [Candidatus Hodarchaeota archaeon]